MIDLRILANAIEIMDQAAAAGLGSVERAKAYREACAAFETLLKRLPVEQDDADAEDLGEGL